MTQTLPSVITGINHESGRGPSPDFDQVSIESDAVAARISEDGHAREIAWGGVFINHGATEAIQALLENAARDIAQREATALAAQELLAKAREARDAQLAAATPRSSGWLRRLLSFR